MHHLPTDLLMIVVKQENEDRRAHALRISRSRQTRSRQSCVSEAHRVRAMLASVVAKFRHCIPTSADGVLSPLETTRCCEG
jgi:hypothetical protein